MPDVAPPCVQREEDVEVPERQRLEDEVEDGRAGAELREAEDAHQAAHARGRRYAGCAQPRLDVFEQRRAARRGRDMDEQARVALEGVLPDVGAVELAVHPAGGRKRQDHAERDRHEPPGSRDRAGRVQQDQQPDCRGGQHDGHPQAPQRRRRRTGPGSRPIAETCRARPACTPETSRPCAAKCSRQASAGASSATARLPARRCRPVTRDAAASPAGRRRLRGSLTGRAIAAARRGRRDRDPVRTDDARWQRAARRAAPAGPRPGRSARSRTG